MAKGYNNRGMRGFGSMGGGMNTNMLRQVQKMQTDMQKMQNDLEEKEYVAQAGGGAVKVVVNGKHELKRLDILPDAASPEDVELLQDMILLAVNDAMRQVEEDAKSSMGKLTGGLNLGALGL